MCISIENDINVKCIISICTNNFTGYTNGIVTCYTRKSQGKFDLIDFPRPFEFENIPDATASVIQIVREIQTNLIRLVIKGLWKIRVGYSAK